MMVTDVAVRGYLKNLVGEDGLEMVGRASINELTDEKIAEETDANLNTVRRTLFILYENRLANYRRERDTDSGWLTYLWKLDLSNLNRQLEIEAKKLLKNLKKKLEFEEDKVFYLCEKQDGRFLFEVAAELEFKCPLCGGDLIYQENESVIHGLKQRIIQLEEMTTGTSCLLYTSDAADDLTR